MNMHTLFDALQCDADSRFVATHIDVKTGLMRAARFQAYQRPNDDAVELCLDLWRHDAGAEARYFPVLRLLVHPKGAEILEIYGYAPLPMLTLDIILEPLVKAVRQIKREILPEWAVLKRLPGFEALQAWHVESSEVQLA